jgi:hypothetical protein
MNKVNVLLQRARLALQEFGPLIVLFMLPGGTLIILGWWLHRHWPLNSVTPR